MRNPIPAPHYDESDINLTPMLDVVFIMLVFFLVTASFLRETGLDVDRPPRADTDSDIESISVLVQRDSSFIVNGRVLTRGSLVSYLQALRSQAPDASFSVVVADGSKVKDTVAAADAGHAVGFSVIPIIERE